MSDSPWLIERHPEQGAFRVKDLSFASEIIGRGVITAA
jgi:hypothetical protein